MKWGRNALYLFACVAWLAAVELFIERAFKTRRRSVPSWYALMMARASSDGGTALAQQD